MAVPNRDYIADVCNFIFDDNVTPQQVNNRMAQVAARAYHEALRASKALDLVPLPSGFRPGVVWLVSNAVRAFWRNQGRRRIYTMAKNTAKLRFRTSYEMAKMGL